MWGVNHNDGSFGRGERVLEPSTISSGRSYKGEISSLMPDSLTPTKRTADTFAYAT